jgi:sulfur transfer complex TusBCD TusB component (DsrH family)
MTERAGHMNLLMTDELLEAASPQLLEQVAHMSASVRFLADDLRARGVADVQVSRLILGVALAASWPSR